MPYEVVMRLVEEAGITAGQIQEAMGLLSDSQAPVPEPRRESSRRQVDWRGAVPYDGAATVRVVPE